MRTTIGILALALTVPLVGCSAFDDEATSGVQVAAAFYPLQYVADRVAGGHADVTNLTSPGKEPHDLEPTIKETALITQADVVVYELGLQPSIDNAVEQNAGGTVVDAAEVVRLETFAHDESLASHTDDDGHDGHDHESIDGGLDPHFWQDPLRMADLGDAIAKALSKVDADNAADYAANAAALRADLEALDQDFTTGLADCERHTLVVSHDAFGYLGRYGVDVAPVAGLSPDAEPTPAGLARLQQLITDDGITTVFGERLASPRLTDALARDMGVETAVLDPIEGLTDETATEDYLSLMRENLAALEEANACR